MSVVTTVDEVKREPGDGMTRKEINERNTRLATFIQVKATVEETARMLYEGKGYFADIEDDDGVIRPGFLVRVSVQSSFLCVCLFAMQ